MSKPKKAGTNWTLQDVKQLKQLAKGNTPTRVMALKLQDAGAVQSKASELGMSLKPTNQSPYG